MLRGKGTLSGHLWGRKSKNCCDSNGKIFAAFSKAVPDLYMPRNPLGTADAVTSVRAFGQSWELGSFKPNSEKYLGILLSLKPMEVRH